MAAALKEQNEVTLTEYQMKPFATSQDVVYDKKMQEHFVTRVQLHLGKPVIIVTWRHENDNYNLGRLVKAVVRLAPQDN